MKNINVNLWKKDVTIISNEDSKIETKYKKCFFNPIIVTNNKDELTIKGSIKRIWLIPFLQIMLLIGLLVVFYFLLRPLIIKNYLWYTANIVLACLVQALVMIFISLIYNDNKITIKIPKDYKINNFKINTKIVNLFLEDISVNNLSLNLINSNIKIKALNFNNIDLNLINSKIDFKECNSLNTHTINNFKTKITKGKVDINGLRINNLETIVNRGQILMENMIINNDDLTLRSGAILYKDVNINYGLKTNITSGEFNACKIALIISILN